MGKSAANALIQYESAVTEITEALTDSGDHQIFTGSAEVWSGDGDLAPTIMPDGIITGTNILSPHADNDKLSYTGFTSYDASVVRTKTAGTVTITRASTGTHVINGIHFDGTSVTAVKGTEGTAFSTTRGAAGGPPFIAVGSIEIGQVKTSSQTAGAILTTEIFQSPNDGTQERYDSPNWYTPSNLGLGNEAEDSDQEHAHLKFQSALPLSHTGGIPKAVWVTVNEPDFADVEESTDWVPAELAPSVTSKQKYRITTAVASSSLGAASFKIYWSSPTSNALRKKEGRTLTFRVYHDYNITDEYELTQGIIGFKSTNPVADDMGADVTIAASTKTVRFD